MILDARRDYAMHAVDNEIQCVQGGLHKIERRNQGGVNFVNS
jgi:hypothetical protein